MVGSMVRSVRPMGRECMTRDDTMHVHFAEFLRFIVSCNRFEMLIFYTRSLLYHLVASDWMVLYFDPHNPQVGRCFDETFLRPTVGCQCMHMHSGLLYI